MKTKLAIALTAVFTMISAQAATVVFTNANGFDTSAITNSAGVAYSGPGATFQVGYFTITDSAIQAATLPTTLVSNFVAFGGSTSFSTFTLGGPPSQNNRGFTTLNAPATTIAGSAFSGKNMYMFVTGAGNNEFGVFKSTLLFDPADDPTLPNVTKVFTTANTPNQNILVGGTGFSVATNNNDNTVTQSWSTKSLVAVPEPSAVLLGAIGVLGLLRRRRI
jgi:hypothetical protein